MNRRWLWISGVLLLAALGACRKDAPIISPYNIPISLSVPNHFPKPVIPEDNQLTVARVELGKKLFFDPILSLDNTISCSSCHLQENAFADPRKVSLGVGNLPGKRNAPAIVNLAYGKSFFWHGSKPTLEQQVSGPIENPVEMINTVAEVVNRMKNHPEYPDLCRKAYNSEPNAYVLTRAIACYMRFLVSCDAPYDRYLEGDENALTTQQKRGMTIFFNERAECFHCHTGFNFTDESFQNNGLYLVYPDSGRWEVTGKYEDIATFKVPTLRNVEVTGPYMHDGSFTTLEEVVEHYNSGGKHHFNQSNVIRPLGLTTSEKADLVAFLKSLTDQRFLTNPAFRP